MSANMNSATLGARDPSRDDSLNSAQAWLPEGERSGARGQAGKKGSEEPERAAAEKVSDGARQWLPEPNGLTEVRPAQPRERPGQEQESKRQGSERRANGGPADSGAELSALEELAALQKIEISVLARR